MKKRVFRSKNQSSISYQKELRSQGLYASRVRRGGKSYIYVKDKKGKIVGYQRGNSISDLSKSNKQYLGTEKTIQTVTTEQYSQGKSLQDNTKKLKTGKGFYCFKAKLKTTYYYDGHKERYISSSGFPSRRIKNKQEALDDLERRFNAYRIEEKDIESISIVKIKRR